MLRRWSVFIGDFFMGEPYLGLLLYPCILNIITERISVGYIIIRIRNDVDALETPSPLQGRYWKGQDQLQGPARSKLHLWSTSEARQNWRWWT